jgi:hypothetical protein
MKIQILALAAAVSAMAGAAFADGPAQATLQTPVAKTINVIAGEAYWTCEGPACTAGGASGQSLTVSACKEIAKAVGPVTAYTVDGSSLSATQLAKCNASVMASAH